jgi:hypothetical protein
MVVIWVRLTFKYELLYWRPTLCMKLGCSAFHAMVLEDKEKLAPVYAQALKEVMHFLEKRTTH